MELIGCNFIGFKKDLFIYIWQLLIGAVPEKNVSHHRLEAYLNCGGEGCRHNSILRGGESTVI